MENKIELNLIPFYAEALALNKYLYNDIDKLYQKNKYEFYKYAKKSQYYNSIIADEASLLTAEYFRKCIGILEYSNVVNNEEINRNIYNLFKKGYKKTYNFFKNNKINEIEEYTKYLSKYIINMTDDEVNCTITAALFFIICDELNIELGDIPNMLQLRWENYTGFTRLSYKTFTPELKIKIANLKKGLPNNIFDYILKASPTSNIIPYDYLYDAENLSFLTIFNELDFKNSDIDEIISVYIINEKYFSDANMKLFDYVIPALHIKALIKAYKKVKEIYFQNNKETMFLELGNIENELKQANSALANIKSKCENLQCKNEKLKIGIDEENIELKKKLRELENKLSQANNFEKEIFALREFVFNNNKAEEIEVNKQIDISYINSIKCIIAGGHPNWQNKLKEVLTNWKFISADVNNINAVVFDDAQIIIFNTSYLNHPMYYKIIDITKKKNIKIAYVDNVNIEQTLQNIYKILQK